MEMSGQLHATAALTHLQITLIHGVGGCMDSSVWIILYPRQICNPDSSVIQSVA